MLSGTDYAVGKAATGEMRLLLPLAGDDVFALVGAQYARRESDAYGSLCVDNIDAAYCAAQSIRRTNRLGALELGFGFSKALLSNLEVRPTVAMLLGSVRRREDGMDVVGQRTKSKAFYGTEVSVESTWWLKRRSPVGLTASASLGTVTPISLSRCGDCWEPFDKSFATARFSMGVTVRRRTVR